jgi:hypothetical protein
MSGRRAISPAHTPAHSEGVVQHEQPETDAKLWGGDVAQVTCPSRWTLSFISNCTVLDYR